MGKEYTLKELANKIGYSYYTVNSWIKERGMPVHRAPPRGRFSVDWEEFSTWFRGLRNG